MHCFWIDTSYLNGRLTPQLSAAWDPAGAFMILPEVSYTFDPWRIGIQAAIVDGDEDVSFGFLRDRDQISFTLTLVF